MNTPKSFVSLLAPLWLMLCASAFAQGELRSLEDAIETSTDEVYLPSSQPGSLSFRNCPQPCARASVEITNATKFYVSDAEVTYQEFNRFISRGGPQFLMVFHEPGGSRATRLIVFGQLQ
jgi:formylglycine-generating enzyme required for sulfatase activity